MTKFIEAFEQLIKMKNVDCQLSSGSLLNLRSTSDEESRRWGGPSTFIILRVN